MKNLLTLFLVFSTFVAFSQKPNIIFIFSDDHTTQAISAYGSKIAKTPNIDRIVNSGAILYNNVVTNSICGPSRATLLTGKFSHMNGYKVNEKVFNIDQAVFPEALQKNGYQTAWVGKMHLGALPHGFDFLNVLPGQGFYYNPDFINKNNEKIQYEGYVSNLITKFSKEWLEQRDQSKPFFMVVGHKATHREWFPDIQDLGSYDDVNFPIPDNFYDNYEGRPAARDQDMTVDKTMVLGSDLKVNVNFNNPTYKRFTPAQKAAFYEYYQNKVTKEFEEKHLTGKAIVEWKFQRYMRDYLSTARSLDRNIGELLDYLDKTGLSKNTVVIYASDQGFYLGEHGWFDKRFIYEESLKTPFVIKYPGKIKPGTKVQQVVSNVDWAPTVLDMAGVKPTEGMQGKSFYPLLQNPNKSWDNKSYYHYYEYPQPHRVAPHFGLRTDQYTLAKFYGPQDLWELYDIKKDPKNMKNLYGDKAYAGVIKKLKSELKAKMIEYKDTEALELFNKEQK